MLRSVDDLKGDAMISTEQIESLRTAAKRVADDKQDELHAQHQRIAVDTEAIEQLVAAVTPALAHVAEVVRVTVAPNVQREVTRRGIRVIGGDFETPTMPIYSWPRAAAVYLSESGILFEVVRTAPDKPDDQAADWRKPEHPRCVVFTNVLAAETVATQYPGAAVEIAKALNRYMAVVGAR